MKEVVTQINALKGVKSAAVRLASNSGELPYLRIETNPVVLENEYGEKIYCPSGVFDIAISEDDIRDRPDIYKAIQCSKDIPHPSISPTTGPMFGKSTWPLRDALHNKDYLSVAFILCGWYATFPPYRMHLGDFTKATRYVTGWVD